MVALNVTRFYNYRSVCRVRERERKEYSGFDSIKSNKNFLTNYSIRYIFLYGLSDKQIAFQLLFGLFSIKYSFRSRRI